MNRVLDERGAPDAPTARVARRKSLSALPPLWISVDPGAVHVGLAVWAGDSLASAEETTPEALLDLVSDSEPALIVMEDFSLMSPRWSKAQAKRASQTLRLIGGVEALARLYGGRVVLQQPSVRHVAQRSPYWAELQHQVGIPSNGHARSAAAHGLYRLRFGR